MAETYGANAVKSVVDVSVSGESPQCLVREYGCMECGVFHTEYFSAGEPLSRLYRCTGCGAWQVVEAPVILLARTCPQRPHNEMMGKDSQQKTETTLL